MGRDLLVESLYLGASDYGDTFTHSCCRPCCDAPPGYFRQGQVALQRPGHRGKQRVSGTDGVAGLDAGRPGPLASSGRL